MNRFPYIITLFIVSLRVKNLSSRHVPILVMSILLCLNFGQDHVIGVTAISTFYFHKKLTMNAKIDKKKTP